MTGPIGLPEGPDSLWKVPFYIIKLIAIFFWVMVLAAISSVRGRKDADDKESDED